ncbi:hypothetical protein [Flammeovirga sp. EKP202]|uniref:hypothetical protein n=1 Tax=Flammeovirga sp. EKP202 TaxID=2770592 RepID=UPI00165F2418|nr:hypothetical protein [Flammeovirga sp. EKP202]MBD0404417.1 hypothetical protein [Flammeovirga sp. EKP202]
MKYFLLLAFSLLLVNISSFAQKVKNEKVKFSYLQYPSKPFPKAERKVKFTTESSNKETVAKMKKDYETIIANIDKKYAQDLADLKRRQAAYDSSSTGSKIMSNIILGDGRPSDTLVKKQPYPLAPVYPKVIDGSAQVHSRISLKGISVDESAATTIKFTFLGMEHTDRQLVVENDTVYHGYVYTIKNPVKVTATTKDGNILYDGFVNDSNNFTRVIRDEEKDSVQLEEIWLRERVTDIRKNEDMLLMLTMNKANDLLNDLFGYVVEEKSIKVFMGASKKDIYPEHAEAYNNAILGYHLLENESDFNKAKEYLDLSIAVWEKSLEEKNTGDKKAKINAKVAGGLHFNIVAAALFTRDFEKVAIHSAQLKVLGEGKYKRQLASIDKFIDDYKARYTAYVTEAGMTE